MWQPVTDRDVLFASRDMQHACWRALPLEGEMLAVLVVSAGGVGTTYIMAQLQAGAASAARPLLLNNVQDQDKLKHTSLSGAYLAMLHRGQCTSHTEERSIPFPCPHAFIAQPHRVVYLMSDPLLAVASIFRRRYATQLYQEFHPEEAVAATIRQPLWQRSSNYSDYVAAVASAGRDLLGVSAHFDSWTQQLREAALGRRVPTLFVSAHRLMRNASVLEQFLGMPPGSVHLELRERVSTLQDEPPAYVDVYARLRARMDALHGTALGWCSAARGA